MNGLGEPSNHIATIGCAKRRWAPCSSPLDGVPPSVYSERKTGAVEPNSRSVAILSAPPPLGTRRVGRRATHAHRAPEKTRGQKRSFFAALLVLAGSSAVIATSTNATGNPRR